MFGHVTLLFAYLVWRSSETDLLCNICFKFFTLVTLVGEFFGGGNMLSLEQDAKKKKEKKTLCGAGCGRVLKNKSSLYICLKNRRGSLECFLFVCDWC